MLCASVLAAGLKAYAQPACPTSGTVSSTCRTVGDLTVNGTLNIDPGVTFEVTGRITYTGRIINASGAIIDAGSMREQWAGSHLNGGTYNVAGDFTTAGNFESTGIIANVSGEVDFGGNGTDHTYTNSDYYIQGDLSFGGGTHDAVGSRFDAGQGYAGTTGVDALSLNGSTVLNLTSSSEMNIRGDVNAGNSAVVNIDNSHMYVTGDFDNAGSGVVTITNGGTLTVDGDYDNAGSGSTTVDGGGMVVGGDYEGDDPIVTGGGAEGCSGGSGGCCGSACSGMPVTLVSFKASAELGHIQLSWQTSSELNNDYFNILRSSDGVNFEIVDTIVGNGTTNELVTYQWADYPLQKGIYYYQLQQVDYDGSSESFSIKMVNFNLRQNGGFIVYPMPLTSGKDFYISLQDEKVRSIFIYDLAGGTNFDLNYIEELGKLRVNFSELRPKPGIYIIKITTSLGQYTQKLKVH